MIQDLHQAALRGVQIYILTNSFESNDVPFVSTLSRYYYWDLIKINRELEQKGMTNRIHLYEWQGPLFGESVNHSKFAIADRELSIVGSYNLYPRSEKKDSETVLIYESTNLAEELADIFEQDDLPKAKEISEDLALKWHETRTLEMPLSKKLLAAEN
jgi:phosphatidylserine/phosphatidylglycerophosphate/cardiolipin synthase-like enzyme